MPEQLESSQRTLKERTETFVAARLEPLSSQHADDDESLRREVIAASREAGLFGIAQPRRHGGLEAGIVEQTVVREALAASGLPARRHVLGPGPGFLAAATGTLAERYLEPLLRGEIRTAFAFTDRREGPPTEARRNGGHWTISGTKAYVTGGADADCFGVVARLADAEGSLFAVVDTDAPGLTVSAPFRSLDGSHHVSLTFADVRVDDDHLLGAPGEGLPRAMRQIGDTRLAMSAEACGLMQFVLAQLEQHLLAPHRSGSALADREGVRLRFADARIAAYAARSMLYRSARLAATGENVVNEVIACKVFASETLGGIVDTAIQLEGGHALVEGHPLERLYREVRVLRLAEGANDLLRLNLARGRFELGKGRI